MAKVDDSGLISAAAAAVLCGVTDRAFRKWEVKPAVKAGRITLFRLSDVRAACALKRSVRKFDDTSAVPPILLTGEATAKARAGDGPDSMAAERRRLVSAQTEALVLKNAATKKELVPAADFCDAMAVLGSMVAQAFRRLSTGCPVCWPIS